MISFVSKAWGGRASDREIVHQSGFLEILDAGDRVMADRGFPIQNDLILRQCILEIPPSSSGQEQMTKSKVQQTKKVANIRIHVERAIGRVKWFSILRHTLPISLTPLLDDIVTVCSAYYSCKCMVIYLTLAPRVWRLKIVIKVMKCVSLINCVTR